MIFDYFVQKVVDRVQKEQTSSEKLVKYIPLLDNIDEYDLRQVVLTPREITYMKKLKNEKLFLNILEKYSVMTSIAFLESKNDDNVENTRGFLRGLKFISDQIRLSDTKKSE